MEIWVKKFQKVQNKKKTTSQEKNERRKKKRRNMNTERIEEAIQKIKSFKQGESAAHIDK